MNQEIVAEPQRIKENLNQQKSPTLILHEDAPLRFQNSLYVQRNVGIRKQSLEEDHNHSKISTFMRKRDVWVPEVVL